MNLNYGYDKQTLIAFTQGANTTLDEHNIVIDYDGEVIIDPEMHFPTVSLDKYMFATTIKRDTLNNWMTTVALYDALETRFYALERIAIPAITPFCKTIKLAA